ncbi:hypothetical protein BD779DRAFT_1611982 [Infundibulicybe gibba]|nr:hypothetical protein BD779DRAFT_1611982 [Infundibulicybe gibba]
MPLRWIASSWTWPNIRITIRCAIAAWVSAVLFIIPAVEQFMGQVRLCDPFMAVLERELTILLFVTLAWAWGCLGIRLADLPRRHRDPNASLLSAFTGQYIEAAPTVIMAIFIFFGSVFFLYIRARQGPGPYLFASVFACICLVISLTTAALFPFPFYQVGQSIVIPLAFHSAISLIASIVIFPSTISAQFTSRLQIVISPLIKSIELHRGLMQFPLGEDAAAVFSAEVTSITESVSQSESALVPLAAAARLLRSDLIYARFSPEDFSQLQKLARRIVGRANGMGMYFTLIDPTRERFPVTPGPSVPATPIAVMTPTAGRSRPASVDLNVDAQPEHTRIDADSQYRRHHSHHHHHHHHLLREALHLSIPRPSKKEHAVGVFESHRYLNLEATHLHDPKADHHTAQTMALLSSSCDGLLGMCHDSLIAVREWLGTVRDGRWDFWVGKGEREIRFTQCLDPYRPSFQSDINSEYQMPAHRYLFHCYVYQYHLIQFSGVLLDMFDEIIQLETIRKHNRFWTPVQRLLRWDIWQVQENAEKNDDEDPGWLPSGCPPPRNAVEWVMSKIYHAVAALGGGNSLFALKAGILTILLCLPSLLKSTASFAYKNRFIWAIFMGQLTLARFRGDTAFGLTARILSTFLGGVVGMVMWYISAGSGAGNAFGLAAVCAVCFPFFFYARLYWPGPPMTNLVFFTTAILVAVVTSQRRFVLVTVGVAAAFVFSFLPPSTTIRRYQRTTLATTSSELGAIFCAILSFANSKEEREMQEIITSLIAVRSKLKRSLILRTNVIYEVCFYLLPISLRGRWPAERYHKILELQLQIAYSLSHLMSVVEHLEPAWTRAFLKRTRFLDPDFQGDLLAVISMISSSLRTGNPLPQITPCPLLDRFMLRYHGLNVIHQDSEEDYGLSRTLTIDTLQDEQYMVFCVGVSTAFGIISRLDRLMVAVKEVVGEQYHVHGVGLIEWVAPDINNYSDFTDQLHVGQDLELLSWQVEGIV